MAKLWVHVKRASLDEQEFSSVVTVLKLGSTTRTTIKAETPNPVWNEDYLFTVEDVNRPLIVEIHKASFLSRKLLGLATIPLYNVRHSNKPGEGHWCYLFLPTPSGKLLPTQHQIQLDTHFKLPEDLPEDVAEELEKKLQAMDNVLEKEVEAIQAQHHKLVTGELVPPTSQQGDFKYISQSRSTSSTENPSPPHAASVTPPEENSESDSFDATDGDGPIKPARERVNAIHEGMITPFHSGSDSEGEIECSEATARWRSVLKNAKFQLLMLEQQRHRDPNTGNGSGGTTSLAQLVDQLKAFRHGQNQKEQNVQSLITGNTAFLTRSHRAISKRRLKGGRHFIEGDLRMQVYRRTLEALVYPVSESQKHNFEKWTAHRPTVCSECSALLWGITKQGVKCSRCSKICHERCSSLATQDCFLRDHHSAICEKMQMTVVNHPKRFNTLREAFNIPEGEHTTILAEIQRHILDLVDNFKAEITVKVIAAQGLNTRKYDRRIFVSVVVGHTKKKTKVYRASEEDRSQPQWKQEEFAFFSNNYHDILQIRVWNERDSALARFRQSMTKEGDIFLGERIIEVRRIGPVGCKNVWYKLNKRTEDADVSGYLWLNLSSEVEGDEVASASFYDMYLKLHEQMFYHTYFHENQPLKEVGPKPESSDGGQNEVKLFPNIAQEILDEFALRYSIDSIYRMMIHMELLVNHHSLKNALSVMGNLLKNLKYQMILHVATEHSVREIGASILMQEYLDASNFGGVEFSMVLDRLMSSLASDLQQYREFYPCNDREKLAELTETCHLMSIVVEFQQQAMSLPNSPKLEDIILKNTKGCLKSTFDFIVQNCIPAGNKGQHPGLSTTGKPFQFFYDLLKHIKSVIYEDKTIYSATIAGYVSFDLGNVSAEEMWRYFGTTIQGLFDEEENNELFPPNEYMQLLFAVKGFYESHVAKLPSRTGEFPEYSRWFLPCVRRWLHEYQKKAVSFVENAWEDDKQRLKFARHEKQFYSSSTYQMFFYLHEGLGLLKSVETESNGCPDIKFEHFYDFAQVIRGVVQHYVDMISMHIPECIEDLEKACMLLNNLQALRVNVQSLFAEMGGAKGAGPNCSKVLNDFQASVLTKELTSWCSFVGRSSTASVLQGVTLLQIELLKLKGQSGVDRKDAKTVVGPLLDAITKTFQVIAASSENLVIQKVVKVVWYVVHESLHRMLLPMLKWEQEGTASSENCVQFQTHYYTGRQCTALEIMLEILKDFFTAAESHGVKPVAMDKGIKQLRGVISLYRQTTEMLITDFIADEVKHVQNTGAMCGEVFLEIDAFLHPIIGELDGNIRVVSASNLKTLSGVGGTVGSRGLKPYVELHILTPNVTTRYKRKFATRYRSTGSPSFNESFKFTLESLDNAELQVVVRNHVMIGTDKIIGMAVVPFSLVHLEANLSLGLSPFIPISDRGYALLNVLSVRTNDEFAKGFVDLKLNQRVTEDVPMEK